MFYKVMGEICFAFLLDISEVNYNFGGHYFGDLEVVGAMLYFRIIIYRDLINNPYLRKYDIVSEACNSNSNKHTHEHIIVNILIGKISMAIKFSDPIQNTPSTTVPAGFNE